MKRLVQSAFAADPEIRFAACTKTGGGIVAGLFLRHFHDETIAERRQRLCIESFRKLVIGDGKADVVDHQNLPQVSNVGYRFTNNVLVRVFPASAYPRARMSAMQSSCHSFPDNCSITTPPAHSNPRPSLNNVLSTP